MTTTIIMGIAAITAVLAIGIVSMEPAYGCLGSAGPVIGCVGHFAGNFAPRDYALCDGQLLPISQNTALFSILGTTYGGDGRTTFGLPDARGRTLVHPGNGPGLDPVSLGAKFGSNSHTLTVAQMPSHTHSLNAQAGSLGTTNTPANDNVLAKTWPRVYSTSVGSLTSMHGASIGNSGSNQSFDLEQPSIGVNCVIGLFGTFPSRN